MGTFLRKIAKYLFAVCCAMPPGISADSEFGIFKTIDGGQNWQSFDGTIAMSEDACLDPDVIPSTSADSTLTIETKLFIANPGSNTQQQTFLRFINPNEDVTSVEVYGIDDGGNFSSNSAMSFNLDGGASKQITAQDLENGNAAKDLTGHFCDGQGKWQLQVRADNPVEVVGLIRTPDGFLTSLADVVPTVDDINQIYFVNPANNTTQQTFLRIVNTTSESGSVTISGVDDTGATSAGTVTFSLAADEAKQITSQDLENGNSSKGLSGSLDDGSVVVMEQNPSWGNRVIGLTDEGHNALAIDPVMLERDDENGTVIYPKHVHKALRRHLGLENTAVDAAFQFTNTEDFGFFG